MSQVLAPQSPPKRNRVARTLLAREAPNWPWLIVFVALIGVITIIALKFPDLTSSQVFFFRIIIALAAAGIGAIIPGFLQIQIKVLDSAVRAGGALALFVLIFLYNPPELGHQAIVPDFAGEWTYECDAIDKEYRHGGTAKLRAERTAYGINLFIEGTREWRQLGKAPREDIQFKWHSSWGTLTAADKFTFEYNVEKSDAIIHGFAWGDITFKNQKPTLLDGNFYQVPPTDPLFGHMVFKRVGR